MSAFSAFRVASRSAGATYLRFQMRASAYPLLMFLLLWESVPGAATVEWCLFVT